MKLLLLIMLSPLIILGVVGFSYAAAPIPENPPVQFNPIFPETNPSTRALINNKRYFRSYQGQGTLYVRNFGTKSAEIYINGKKIDSNLAFKSKDAKTVLDISKYTKDGENFLEVRNINPSKPPTTSDIAHFELYIDYPTLRTSTPESVGLAKDCFSALDKEMQNEISIGFPAAQIIVVKNGKIIKNSSYGYTQVWDRYQQIPLDKRTLINNNTLFDLASNSKMYATNYALMHLVSQGKVNVNDKVSKYLKDFTGGGRENILVRNLLEHNAGFAPEITFFKEKGAWYSQDRKTTIELLMKAPLVYPTGSKSVYSDTDFMLLGLIVEAASGMREDEYVRQNIYQPLGLTRTTYNPLDNGFTMNDCAATERNGNTRDGRISFPNVRTYTLRGEVHDEKAWYSMAGVAGHAGLFSTASELAILMQTMLNRGGYGTYQLCDPITEGYFTQLSNATVTRGLGWLKPGYYSYDDTYYTFGPYAPITAFGHNGWTGTMTVIDPEHDLAIALLTDCIHSPGLANDVNGFVCKAPPFEAGLMGGIIALVYEALNK